MFKSKAINAQGTILAIDDGDGHATRGHHRDHQSPGGACRSIRRAAVGDVVRFGVVADMPEIEGLIGVVTASACGNVHGQHRLRRDSRSPAARVRRRCSTFVARMRGQDVQRLRRASGRGGCHDALLDGARVPHGSAGLRRVQLRREPRARRSLSNGVQRGESRARQSRFKLTLPVGRRKQLEYTFDAFVRQFSITGGVDQAVTGSVVLRVTGEPCSPKSFNTRP